VPDATRDQQVGAARPREEKAMYREISAPLSSEALPTAITPQLRTEKRTKAAGSASPETRSRPSFHQATRVLQHSPSVPVP